MKRTLLLLPLLALDAASAAKKSKSKAAKADSLSSALARGDEFRQKADYKGAEQAYRAAAKLEPTRAEPHFFLGMTARAAGRTDDAMAHYEQALALSPQLAEAHMNVASLLSQMPGREEEALEHYAKALELREWPLDLAAQAEYNSGICLYNLGRTEEARVALERAIGQAPTFAPARELLEQIETEQAEGPDGVEPEAEEEEVEEEEAPPPDPSPPASRPQLRSAAQASAASEPPAAAAAAAPPRRTAWRQAGGESTCEGGGGAASLEGAMAQLELQLMHALGQPEAAPPPGRSAQLAQLIGSMSTLLARDLRSQES